MTLDEMIENFNSNKFKSMSEVTEKEKNPFSKIKANKTEFFVKLDGKEFKDIHELYNNSGLHVNQVRALIGMLCNKKRK